VNPAGVSFQTYHAAAICVLAYDPLDSEQKCLLNMIKELVFHVYQWGPQRSQCLAQQEVILHQYDTPESFLATFTQRGV
jgi:hypothetical protein